MGLESQLIKAQQWWQRTTWISKASPSTPTQGVIWANVTWPLDLTFPWKEVLSGSKARTFSFSPQDLPWGDGTDRHLCHRCDELHRSRAENPHFLGKRASSQWDCCSNLSARLSGQAPRQKCPRRPQRQLRHCLCCHGCQHGDCKVGVLNLCSFSSPIIADSSSKILRRMEVWRTCACSSTWPTTQPSSVSSHRGVYLHSTEPLHNVFEKWW